jgi:DNA polymerase III epsilon subunit-like protein
MGYIVIDTETTGLFRHHNLLPDGTKVTARSDEPGQPRMAQYAHVLLDDEFNIEAEYTQYVLPEGWQNGDRTPMLEMPPEAFAVHGITMDFLRGNGLPVRYALDRYETAIKVARILIGFNQQHDGRQIRAELRHAGRDDLFEVTPNICAMRSITMNYKGQVKKLNGKGGFPRLIDAAAHFGIPYPEDRRHNALEDATVTAMVAKELHQRGLLLPAEVHYSRNFEGRQGVEA